MTDPSDRVVAAEDVESTSHEHGDRAFERRQLGAAAGGEDLSCSLYAVDPGKRTWPRHFHTGNEEAVFVLDGEGTLYLGPDAEPHALSPGTYVSLPATEAAAHEIANTGEETLRFLAVSTMNDPDVTVYPDKDAVGIFAGAAPGGDSEERSLSTYLDLDAEVPYWDEETTEAETE